MLDEALAEESEGPTPPKVSKNGLSSSSFVYQEQSVKEKSTFKSPLKVQPSTPLSHRDKGQELRAVPGTPDEPAASVTTVRQRIKELQSEITKQQTVISQSSTTPLRQVRHRSPERAVPGTPDEPAASVTTVRQRIKELQSEITKQQTVISQSSTTPLRQVRHRSPERAVPDTPDEPAASVTTASQALNLCAATIEFSGSTEQAEGERLLLLASHRRSACVHEMQRLQVEGAGCAGAPGAASLHITAISVTVEVYLLQASKEVLPHDVKYHISSKK
ncbi:Scraps, partial [Operophtera brumata]